MSTQSTSCRSRRTTNSILPTATLVLLIGLLSAATQASGALVFWGDINGRVYSADPDIPGQSPTLILSQSEAITDIAVSARHDRILFTTSWGVFMSHLDGSGFAQVGSSIYSADGAAINKQTGMMYWGRSNGTILRSTIDGTNIQEIVPAGSALRDLEVNSSTGHVYWTDSQDNRIARADHDGANVQTVLSLSTQASPWKLNVDSIHGTLYWTEFLTRRVRRVDADGSNAVLIANESVFPLAVSSLPQENELYWLSLGVGLRRSDLDGNGATTIRSMSDSVSAITVIPEPSTLLFVGLSLVLALSRRK